MDRNLEYQNTRTFDRDVFKAMFRVQRALRDDDECPDSVTNPEDLGLEAQRGPTGTQALQASGRLAAEVEVEPESPAPTPLQPGEADLAEALDQRALHATACGHFSEARALHEQAVGIRRRLLGDADPWLPQSMTWLGNLALLEEHLDEAHWLHVQALELVEKRHGPEHPARATPLHNLAVVARHRGDLAQAADFYDQALAVKLEHFGWMHPSVASTLTNLGNLVRVSGDLRAALCYFARAREIFEQTTGGVSSGLAAALVGLGRIHLQLGVHVSAAFMFERALRIREALETPSGQLASIRRLLSKATSGMQPEAS